MTNNNFIYNENISLIFTKENIMRKILLGILLLVSLSGCVVVTTHARRNVYEETGIVVHRPIVIERQVITRSRPVIVERQIIIQQPQRHQRHHHHHHHREYHQHRWTNNHIFKDLGNLVFFYFWIFIFSIICFLYASTQGWLNGFTQSK